MDTVRHSVRTKRHTDRPHLPFEGAVVSIGLPFAARTLVELVQTESMVKLLPLMEWLRHMDRQIAQAIESHSCATPTREIDCRDYVLSVHALFLIKDSKDYQAIKARLFDPTFDIQGRSAHHHPWWSQVQQYIHDIQTCMQMAEKLPSEQAMFDWEKKTLQKCTVCTEKVMSEDDVSMTRLKVDL